MRIAPRAFGYLLALSPMALLVSGVVVGAPWFVFAFFFVVLPIVRMLLPDDAARSMEIDDMSKAEFMMLHAVPWLHLLSWSLVLPWTMWLVAQLDALQLALFGLSFWVVTSLNLTVAHELMHRPFKRHRLAARFIAGSIGYFQMVEEHWSHHVSVGGLDNGDSPELDESVYGYAFRRYVRSFRVAQEWERLHQVRHGRSAWRNRIAGTALVTFFAVACFAIAAGWRGVLFYLTVIVGTAFTMQAITYIQHWGLSDHLSPSPVATGYSWEDRCVMQAFVTLNHAYHGHHHLRPSLPYFRLRGFVDSPRLPASYPVMLLAALIPPLFERSMVRRLEAWCAGHGNNDSQRPCANLAEFFMRHQPDSGPAVDPRADAK
ncbi:fatty acid desaturase [Variovorax sp. KK3]|uniref:fatty acid desaturase n=1 Tax=Variovorax sp. KK3 TaxID=1855728 RepID=UPI00097BD167|nr:fatty acid desaturase [Variovorax sp. KK3]